MENERCKITLNNDKNIYYSGETISGIIVLNSKKPRKIRGIYFKLVGYGNCSWSDMLTRIDTTASPSQQQTQQQLKDQTATFSAQEVYISTIVYVIGSTIGAPFEIPKGSFTNTFRYQLKPVLPSSFKGHFGKVKYKLTFIVERPWIFDESYEIPLTIIQTYNLNANPLSRQPFSQQTTRNIGFIKSGPVTLIVNVIKSGYCTNENIIVKINLINYSPMNVDKVKVSMYQIIRYNSNTPVRATKEEIFKVMKKDDVMNCVEKRSERSTDCILEISNLPTTDNNYHNIVNISYEIKVEAKMQLYKKLTIKLPIIIGSIPLSNQSITVSQPQQPSSSSSVVGPMMKPILPPQPQSLPYGFISNSSYPTASSSTTQPSAPTVPSAPCAPSQNYGDDTISNHSLHSNYHHFDPPPPSYNDIYGSPSHFSNSSQLLSTNNMSMTDSTSSISNFSSVARNNFSITNSSVSSNELLQSPAASAQIYRQLKVDEEKININEID